MSKNCCANNTSETGGNGTGPPTEERLLEWREEASAIMRDVKDHVKEISIANKIQSHLMEIFLNVTTLEEERFCVKVSGQGFQLAGRDYDTKELLDVDKEDEEDNVFETPYALLSSISQCYVQSFGNNLIEALNTLKDNE